MNSLTGRNSPTCDFGALFQRVIMTEQPDFTSSIMVFRRLDKNSNLALTILPWHDFDRGRKSNYTTVTLSLAFCYGFDNHANQSTHSLLRY